MLEDKDDDWPPAARHLADRPLAARPLAAGRSAARRSAARRSAARCGRGRTRNEGAKGSSARHARPTLDAPDPTRGANDRTGNSHAAPAEHGSACSVPPRAPQHPQRSVTAQWPRHPRSKHYTKRNDKSATNGMMRGAAETPLGELQQRRSVSEGGEHGIQSRDPGRSGPPGILRRPAGTLSEGTRASHVIRVTSATGQTEICSPMQPKILVMPALPAVTTGAHPALGRGVKSHER